MMSMTVPLSVYIQKKKIDPQLTGGSPWPQTPSYYTADRLRTPVTQLANLQRSIFSAMTICEADYCVRHQYDPKLPP